MRHFGLQLNALRAFEAAARLSSFSEAARELHVSHSTISHHAKGLEKVLKLYPEQWFNFFPFWSSVPSVPPGVRTGKAPNYLKEELLARSK